MVTIHQQVQLNTLECPVCGTLFAITDQFENSRRGDGGTFYCPRGHPQAYTTSREKVLQQKLDETERQMRAAKCDALNKQAALEAAQKEECRVLRRAHAGVCQCCGRTFSQLARHMKSKHPEIKP